MPGPGSAVAERDHLQRGRHLQVGGVMSFDRGEVRHIIGRAELRLDIIVARAQEAQRLFPKLGGE